MVQPAGCGGGHPAGARRTGAGTPPGAAILGVLAGLLMAAAVMALPLLGLGLPRQETEALPAPNGSWLPRTPRTVTVMSYNINHGKGLDGQRDLARIARVIDSVSPDVVGLQEVDVRFAPRSLFRDQARWLAAELEMHLAFGPALHWGPAGGADWGGYGNAILSRHPIVAVRNVRLSRQGTREDRAFLHGVLDVGGQRLDFVTTHMGLNAGERLIHTRHLLDYLEDLLPGPVIVVGDWNETPERAAVAAMTDRFLDAAAAHGAAAPTFAFHGPDPRQPNVRIDYIFASPHLEVAEVRTLDTGASDHRPVVARLVIAAPQER